MLLRVQRIFKGSLFLLFCNMKGENCMSWVSGKYGEKDVDNNVFLTTLSPYKQVGRYNLFRLGDNSLAVIFSNQPELLKTVRDNEGSVFAVTFMKPDSHIRQYTVEGEIALTISRLRVAIDAPEGVSLKVVHENPDYLVRIASEA